MKHTLCFAVMGLVLMPFAAVAETVAFVNTTVIPMDSDRVIDNQTVVIEGDRIVEIGDRTDISLAPDAVLIDAGGAYLMPALADMHAHLEIRDRDPGSLLLFLAEGTTTVRSPSGGQLNRKWRDAVNRGELEGPTILTAGRVLLGLVEDDSGHNSYVLVFRIGTLLLPFAAGALGFLIWMGISPAERWGTIGLSRRRSILAVAVVLLLSGGGLYATRTPPGATILPYVTNLPIFVSEEPEQVIDEVRRQHENGADFIKPYDSLTIPEYLTAIAEGKRLGMYVMGHALDEASLETILQSGIDEIAHIDELNFYHWQGDFGTDNFSLDYSTIPDTVALMKDNNVNIVSNLSLDETLVHMIFKPEETLARPEYHVVRPEMIEIWRTEGRQNGRFAEQGPYRRDMEMDFFFELVKALNNAGVIITIGTDTAPFTEGSLPSHIHRELEILVEAGLPNFDALAAGTRNAGLIFDRMGADGSFGTVQVGQRADLLLLRENPLENVSATRDRIGVMVRGRWLPQLELDKRMEDFVATY